MTGDKQIERRRYEQRAQRLERGSAPASRTGAAGVAPIFRAPYIVYEHELARLVRPGMTVLEIGAGTGMHSMALVGDGARAIATDISEAPLRVLSRTLGEVVQPVAADMEALPFADGSFDVVACAGSLSYGDPETVDREVSRVLKPGGAFVCVDSLNHNPVYRFNRWLAYLRGRRTASTLQRMPDERRIASISDAYQQVSVRYFGSVTMLMPVVAALIGEKVAARWSDRVDGFVRPRRSAFKFVLVAEGRR